MNEEALQMDVIKRQIVNVKTSIALMEWTSDQFAAFLERIGVMPANKIEKCMMYIYNYSMQSTGNNNAPAKTEAEIGMDMTTFDPAIVDALASLSADFVIDPEEIAVRISKFSLDEINIPSFEIAFLWLEQLTTTAILEMLTAELGHEVVLVDNDVTIDCGKFVLAFLGTTADMDVLQSYYTQNEISSLLNFRASDTKKGSALDFANATFEQRNIFKKAQKKLNSKNKG